MPRAIVVVNLLFVMWPGGAAADWRPLQVAPSGAVVVPVEIDGRGPFAFLLDTGSSRSAISETLALQLGARPVGQTKVLTPSGRVTRLLTPLPRLTVDGSVPIPSLAMIVPDQDLARGVRAVGIIGADVLARFALTIDYANLRIVWRAVDAVPGSIVLPLAADHGRLTVSVPHPSCAGESAACAPLQLIPDTGADDVVLFQRPGETLPFVTPLGTAAIRSLAGTRVVRRVRIGASYLREARLHGQVASVVTLPPEDTLSVDGLLPLHVFARVTLDGPGKKLTLVSR